MTVVTSCSRAKNVLLSAMHVASQLPGGKPTDVDDAPAPAR